MARKAISLNDLKGLAARLKAVRESFGETQASVGEAVGLTQSHVQRYEGGALEPPLAYLAWFAARFSTSVDYLLTGHEPCHEEIGQQAPAFGRDWIRLPAHDQRPLGEEERGLLEKAAAVLRCPEGPEYPPAVALKGTVSSLWETTAKQIAQDGDKKGRAKTA